MSLRIHLSLLIALFCFAVCTPAALADTPKKTTVTKSDKTTKKTDKKGKSSQKLSLEDRITLTTNALTQAKIAIQGNHFASALSYCLEAMSYSPDDPEIQSLCLALYDRNDQPQNALDLLRKIRSSSSEKTASYDLCFEEATLLTKLHKWGEALDVYETCNPPTEFHRATQLSNAAEIEMIRENPEKAVEMYEASLKIAPANPHAHFGLAVALMRAGRSKDARFAFMRGVAIDPNLNFLDEAFFEPKGEVLFHKAIFSLFSNRNFNASYYLDNNLKHETRPNYRNIAKALKSDADTGAFSKALQRAYPIVVNRVSAIAIDSTTRYIAFGDDENNSVWVLDTETGKYVERVQDCPNVKSMAFDANTGMLHILAKTLRIELDPAAEGGYLYYENSDAEPRWIGFAPDGATLLGIQNKKLVSAPFKSPLETHLIVDVPEKSNNIAILGDGHTMLMHSSQLEFLIDIETDKVLGMPASDSLVLAQAASPDRFAIGLSHAAVLFTAEGELLARIEGLQGQSIKDVAFDPTGHWLLTLSGTLAEIWNVEALSSENVSHELPTWSSHIQG